MPFDFPQTPTIGQVVTGSGGQQWQWDGTKWVVVSSASVGFAPTSTNVGRNLLHNGMFNVQQRGAGPWTANGYTADRWALVVGNDTDSVSVVALADADRTAIGDEAAQYALQDVFVGSAAANSISVIQHKVENTRRVAGKTVTLSFWARATSGTPKIGFGYQQSFGTGGSPSAATSVNLGITPALSSTWTRYTITGTLASAVGKTFGTTTGSDYTTLDLWLSASPTSPPWYAESGNIGVQSGTVNLWGIQLEIGTQATPLEKLELADDLRHCQRFYWGGATFFAQGYGVTGTPIAVALSLPTSMRAIPTITAGAVSNTNLGGASVGGSNPLLAYSAATVTTTGNWTLSITATASADL